MQYVALPYLTFIARVYLNLNCWNARTGAVICKQGGDVFMELIKTVIILIRFTNHSEPAS